MRSAAITFLMCVLVAGTAAAQEAVSGAELLKHLTGTWKAPEERTPKNSALDEQVFGAGAVALIGATQLNVVLLRRFSPQTIVMWALAAAVLAGVVFVGVSYAHIGGLFGFVLPVWAILAPMGLVIPNAPAVALSRHPDAAGTSAALLGAGQFGLGAAVAPLVGILGNDETALALVMTAGMVIALLALLAVGAPATETEDGVTGDAVAEPG